MWSELWQVGCKSAQPLLSWMVPGPLCTLFWMQCFRAPSEAHRCGTLTLVIPPRSLQISVFPKHFLQMTSMLTRSLRGVGPGAQILQGLFQRCRTELHAWRASQQILFDNTKKSMHILDGDHPRGESVKLLGIHYDTKLTILTACLQIAAPGSL